MRSHHRLTDDQLDELLDGTLAATTDTPVVDYLAAVRDAAAATTASPSDELGIVLAEGLAAADMAAQGILTFSTRPAERGILTASTGRGTLTRGILTMRTRSRTLTRVLVTKFAALGLLSKAAVAGATVTVAASSAGAAGVLPPPAQVAFDDAVGRQVAEAPEDDSTDDTEAVTTDDQRPENFGERVSEDARDGGVVGRDIADEASDGRAGGPDEPPGQSGEAPGQSGEAPGQSGEAPGQSDEAPGQSDEAPGQSDEAPGQADEEPSGPSKPETSSPATSRGRAGD